MPRKAKLGKTVARADSEDDDTSSYGDEADRHLVTISQSNFLTMANTKLHDLMRKHKKPARQVFEASSPQTQCFNTIGPCNPKSSSSSDPGCKCWICGLPIYINDDGTEFINRNPNVKKGIKDAKLSGDIEPPHCEHILPVMTATFILGGLYDEHYHKLPPNLKDMIAANYLWAHPVCNLVKGNNVYFNDMGKVSEEQIQNELDNIFSDPRSKILNLYNQNIYSSKGIPYNIIKGSGRVKLTTPGYQDFRKKRVKAIKSKLEEVLAAYREGVEKGGYGFLLLYGTGMAVENIQRFANRVEMNVDVIKGKIESATGRKKRQRLQTSLKENEEFLKDLKTVIRDVKRAEIPKILAKDALGSPAELQTTFASLRATYINKTPPEIIDQLSQMSQDWIVSLIASPEVLSKPVFTDENVAFADALFGNESSYGFKNTDFLNIPRGQNYEDGIKTRVFQPALEKLIAIIMPEGEIEKILDEIKGGILLQEILQSQNFEGLKMPLIEGYEYIISFVQTVYLVKLIERYNEVLYSTYKDADGNEQYNFNIGNEYINNSLLMLQRNLYDALLSLYLKETKNIIRCNTTQLLVDFLSPTPEKNFDETYQRIRSALGKEFQDKKIELPKLQGDNEIVTTNISISDVIQETQPKSAYCRLPVTNVRAQKEILNLDLESPEARYIRSSRRLGELKERSSVRARLEEITDEESGRNDEPEDQPDEPDEDEGEGEGGTVEPVEPDKPVKKAKKGKSVKKAKKGRRGGAKTRKLQKNKKSQKRKTKKRKY